MTNTTAMADDSARFSFSLSSPFEDNPLSNWVPPKNNKIIRHRGRTKSKIRPRSPSNIETKTPSFPLNLPSFEFTPEVFTFGAKSSTTIEKSVVLEEPSEKQEVEQETETLIEQPKVEPPKSLPLISVSRVVKGIPQNPHFWPLRNCSDIAKRLLMEAWDRVLEESADKIQNMKANGFWEEARKLWRTLEELQGMGYNVIVLRRRMVELTDVLVEKRGFKNEIKGLANKAEFHRMEKTRLEHEILELKARVEVEKIKFDDLMGSVEKMEGELQGFDVAFSSLVIMPLVKNSARDFRRGL